METKEINKTELKKQLYKTKVKANFSYYNHGNLFYTVQLEEGLYQFPIETVELDYDSVDEEKGETGNLQLSSDLGTTSFYNEIKASELNRWIDKAIDKNEFIKLTE